MSASRVRELEERLSNEVEQPKTSRAAAAEPGISGDEWSRRLQEEQEKRTGAFFCLFLFRARWGGAKH